MNKIIVITAESYKSIANALNSKDEENHVVGLTTIENIDFKKNLVKILLLKKTCDVSPESWKKHAPKTFAKLKKIGTDPTVVETYKSLLSILVKNNASKDDIQFFLDIFSDHIFKSIKGLGFDFIDDTEITIKLKDNDKQNRVLSESL